MNTTYRKSSHFVTETVSSRLRELERQRKELKTNYKNSMADIVMEIRALKAQLKRRGLDVEDYSANPAPKEAIMTLKEKRLKRELLSGDRRFHKDKDTNAEMIFARYGEYPAGYVKDQSIDDRQFIWATDPETGEEMKIFM